MKPAERKLLDQYRTFRERRPTFVSLLRRSVVVHILLIVYAIIVAWLAKLLDVPPLAWLAAGMVLGGFARDCGYFRRFLRAWPTLESIIDWRRVEELLGARGPGSKG